jgi:hypothetical protein
VLAGVAAVGAVAVAFLLPRERRFVRSEGLLASSRQMLGPFSQQPAGRDVRRRFRRAVQFHLHLHVHQLSLAAPPYNLSASWLGAIFVTYLVARCSRLDRLGGRPFGRRQFMVGVIAIWLAGIALTLAPSLLLIVAGLALGAGCGLICQAVSTGFVTVTAKAGRSSAVGLYVTSFYLGGSFGRPWAQSPGRSAAGRPALRWSRRCCGHGRDRNIRLERHRPPGKAEPDRAAVN